MIGEEYAKEIDKLRGYLRSANKSLLKLEQIAPLITDKDKEDLIAHTRQAKKFLEHWNGHHQLTQCRGLTPQRIRHIQARLGEHPMSYWIGAMGRIALSDFCNGSKGWVATIDWFVMTGAPAMKALEGKYDNRTEKADIPE